MNFITFVFSLLLIFSMGTFVALEKQAGNRRLRATYLGHVSANRKILSKWESEVYKSFRTPPSPPEENISTPKKTEPKEVKIPQVNPECARLNLWPLIQEGREEHPFLYNTALKFLDTFYGSHLFGAKPQAKVFFLNEFLKKAKIAIQKNRFSLEKLALDPSFQLSYYKMLKGTKEWDIEQKIGYPSLLDVIKVEETPSKICLCHAHPCQMEALFNKKAGLRLFHEIHQDTSLPVTKELIEKVCAESHMTISDPDLFSLIDMGRSNHAKKGKTTLIAEDRDTQIRLRKSIYVSSG
jgi:hypothetical protein